MMAFRTLSLVFLLLPVLSFAVRDAFGPEMVRADDGAEDLDDVEDGVGCDHFGGRWYSI